MRLHIFPAVVVVDVVNVVVEVVVIVVVVVCDAVVLVANLETIETKMKISLLHRRRVSLFLFRFEISNKRIEKCSITISGDFSQMADK